MSDESKSKEKTFEFPMMPIFGLDLGRELGSIDARLIQLENDNREIKRDIKELDAKTDKMGHALHRLDERTKTMQTQILVIGGGTLVAVLAGIVLQFFPK